MPSRTRATASASAEPVAAVTEMATAPTNPVQETVTVPSSVVNQLRQLDSLFASRLISVEEHTTSRQRVLCAMSTAAPVAGAGVRGPSEEEDLRTKYARWTGTRDKPVLAGELLRWCLPEGVPDEAFKCDLARIRKQRGFRIVLEMLLAESTKDKEHPCSPAELLGEGPAKEIARDVARKLLLELTASFGASLLRLGGSMTSRVDLISTLKNELDDDEIVTASIALISSVGKQARQVDNFRKAMDVAVSHKRERVEPLFQPLRTLAPRSSSMSQIRCHRCNRMGHFAKDCTFPPRKGWMGK